MIPSTPIHVKPRHVANKARRAVSRGGTIARVRDVVVTVSAVLALMAPGVTEFALKVQPTPAGKGPHMKLLTAKLYGEGPGVTVIVYVADEPAFTICAELAPKEKSAASMI